MRRHPAAKKHHILGKIILLLLLLVAAYAGYIYFMGPQPAPSVQVPGALTKQTDALKQKLPADLPQKAGAVAATGREVGKTVKTGATTLMEKIHTVMYIDQTIAAKRRSPQWVPLAQIPKQTQDALLAIEDHDFYNHGALDISSIARAMLVNATAGEIVEGGSTITQQMVKNLFLSDEQSLSRKAEEATIAFLIEHRYTKQEILELYLNTTYLGSGAYGIKEASQTYFNKAPKNLGLGESCMLAAMPYAPSALNPFKNPAGCAKRMRLVLTSMEKYNLVSKAAADQARFAGVTLKDGKFLSFIDK
ncbi:MAG: transglycosylase domain-containing protein [Acidaminococcaceae bacterium]|jgi:membrane peptidoglycan carboxypeptidase|nr:transglycosylase domain-containing protein [Acidaminococcaceae bacterium]